MVSLSEQFARHVRKSAASSDVADRARLLLADFVAGAVCGASAPSTRAAAAAVATGTAESIAFVAGISAHGLELDDTHEASSLHAGTVIWPAVLALAAEGDFTCDDVVRAAIAGYDATCVLGVRAGGQAMYERGFHPTGVCGTVGAAAAAGALIGLDETQLVAAMGIAASDASGTLAFLDDGGWTKRFHAGAAAANGIRAARLAQHGFRGPVSALDGRFGMLWAFAGGARQPQDIELPAFGSGVMETSIKLYPCCRYIHGTLDLLLDLREQEGLAADQVRHLKCAVLSGGFSLVAAPAGDKANVRNEVEAQFSLPYAAALVLTHGAATLEGFRQADALAPAMRPLMERVECVRSPELDRAYPERWGAAVTVQLNDGRHLERHTAHTRGSPFAALGWPELEKKMSGLIGSERAEQLAKAARNFSGGMPARDTPALRMLQSIGPLSRRGALTRSWRTDNLRGRFFP